MKFNLNDYNGQGMKYQIMVDDVNKYDPNSEKYKNMLEKSVFV